LGRGLRAPGALKRLGGTALEARNQERRPLTVRLPESLHRELEEHCLVRRLSKSQVVIELLESHLSPQRAARSPFRQAETLGLVGCFSSGRNDLSSQRKQLLKEKLRGKHTRRCRPADRPRGSIGPAPSIRHRLAAQVHGGVVDHLAGAGRSLPLPA
jgi:hypothetical protein